MDPMILPAPPPPVRQLILPLVKEHNGHTAVAEAVEAVTPAAIVGTGWLAPMPDRRDYTVESPPVAELSRAVGIKDPLATTLPATTDLRAWCSPVENQLSLGSCTANAAVGVVEYYERRAFGKYLDGSRLFVYKTARNLLGWTGDTGAFLRSTMAALALFGVPPEKFWPYTDRAQPGPEGARTFDAEPTAFVYELADDFGAVTYFNHDPAGKPPADVLTSIKTYLAAGIPAMFGFYGFPSFSLTKNGQIPYPCPDEQAQWGHAIVAVGYDDNLKIANTRCNKTTTGALLIRNSWGPTWGTSGYGWLPYQYVLDRLASDFWSLYGMRWSDTGQFGI